MSVSEQPTSNRGVSGDTGLRDLSVGGVNLGALQAGPAAGPVRHRHTDQEGGMPHRQENLGTSSQVILAIPVYIS